MTTKLTTGYSYNKLNGKGARHTCPKCESNDISASDGEFGSTEASCNVECMNCGLRWYEVFRAVRWEEK